MISAVNIRHVSVSAYVITCACVCVHPCTCAVSCFELGMGWWTCQSQRDTAMFSFPGCFCLDVTLFSCTTAATMHVCVCARGCVCVPLSACGSFFVCVNDSNWLLFTLVTCFKWYYSYYFLPVSLCERPQKMLLVSGECVGECFSGGLTLFWGCW